MFYQADWLLSLESPPVKDGWIHVEADRIVATGTTEQLPAGAAVKTFPGCVLLPGFINAHCHLELTSVHNRLSSRKSFPAWVEELRRFTMGFSASDYREAVRMGIDLLMEGGTTTVVDIGNTGNALPVLWESPLRVFGLVETLGLDPSLAESRFAQASSLARHFAVTPRFHSGVTPHAAYSCSSKLLKAVLHLKQTTGLPFSIHASESREEADLFASASGPLQEFCRRIFPSSPEHHSTTPIQWLESGGFLPDKALVVHGNHLEAEDIALLAYRKATVVHCPSSHAFFGHKSFPYYELSAHGVPVCLGTDSLASGDSLSMLEQIRLFRKHFPEVAAGEILRMATTVAAQALGMGHELGLLKPGFKADFIAMHIPDLNNQPSDLREETLLNPAAEVQFLMVDGKELGKETTLNLK